MVTISWSSFMWMGIIKLNAQIETVGKHLQLFGQPWLNETSIFVGTPKAGIVSELVKYFVSFSGLMILFYKEAMAYYQQ